MYEKLFVSDAYSRLDKGSYFWIRIFESIQKSTSHMACKIKEGEQQPEAMVTDFHEQLLEYLDTSYVPERKPLTWWERYRRDSNPKIIFIDASSLQPEEHKAEKKRKLFPQVGDDKLELDDSYELGRQAKEDNPHAQYLLGREYEVKARAVKIYMRRLEYENGFFRENEYANFYREAYQWYKTAAENGNARGYIQVGCAKLLGISGYWLDPSESGYGGLISSCDYNEAKNFFDAAAQTNNAQGYWHLGLLAGRLKNDGVDLETPQTYFQLAAERGSLQGHNNLAEIEFLKEEKGCEEEAISTWQRTTSQGSPLGYLKLILLNINPPEGSEAAYLNLLKIYCLVRLQIKISQGKGEICRRLGELLLQEDDFLGNAETQFILGVIHTLGSYLLGLEGFIIKPDFIKAQRWFERSNVQGYPLAQAVIGKKLLNINKYDYKAYVPEVKESQRYWLKQMAEHTNPRAQYLWGQCLTKTSPDQDWAKAAYWLRKAGTAGIEQAKAELKAHSDKLYGDKQQRAYAEEGQIYQREEVGAGYYHFAMANEMALVEIFHDPDPIFSKADKQKRNQTYLSYFLDDEKIELSHKERSMLDLVEQKFRTPDDLQACVFLEGSEAIKNKLASLLRSILADQPLPIPTLKRLIEQMLMMAEDISGFLREIEEQLTALLGDDPSEIIATVKAKKNLRNPVTYSSDEALVLTVLELQEIIQTYRDTMSEADILVRTSRSQRIRSLTYIFGRVIHSNFVCETLSAVHYGNLKAIYQGLCLKERQWQESEEIQVQSDESIFKRTLELGLFSDWIVGAALFADKIAFQRPVNERIVLSLTKSVFALCNIVPGVCAIPEFAKASAEVIKYFELIGQANNLLLATCQGLEIFDSCAEGFLEKRSEPEKLATLYCNLGLLGTELIPIISKTMWDRYQEQITALSSPDARLLNGLILQQITDFLKFAALSKESISKLPYYLLTFCSYYPIAEDYRSVKFRNEPVLATHLLTRPALSCYYMNDEGDDETYVFKVKHISWGGSSKEEVIQQNPDAFGTVPTSKWEINSLVQQLAYLQKTSPHHRSSEADLAESLLDSVDVPITLTFDETDLMKHLEKDSSRFKAELTVPLSQQEEVETLKGEIEKLKEKSKEHDRKFNLLVKSLTGHGITLPKELTDSADEPSADTMPDGEIYGRDSRKAHFSSNRHSFHNRRSSYAYDIEPHEERSGRYQQNRTYGSF